MNSIKEWLNSSRNYDIGTALYRSHGANEQLKAMFDQGHSPYRQQKLEVALKELALQCSEEVLQLPGAAQVPITLMPEKTPEHTNTHKEDPYKEKWVPLHAEMKALQHQLLRAKDDEERGKMAFRILDLERQCKYWWDRRDYYHEHGHQMPAEEEKTDGPPPVVNVNALRARLNTVRTYVTKYEKYCTKNNVVPANHPKLQQYLKERTDLETQLGYERAV